MTTIATLQSEIGLQIRDTGNAEVSAAQLITLINSAARDAGSRGWLIPVTESTSLSYTTGTYNYAVPAGFVYIRDLLDDGDVIPRNYWDLRYISSAPTIVFYGEATDIRIETGSVITVLGYQKPTDTYATSGDTVDAGLESFLRDRAAAYALQFMSAGTSELDALRKDQRELKYRDSEIMLQNRREIEDRLVPTLRQVPGR